MGGGEHDGAIKRKRGEVKRNEHTQAEFWEKEEGDVTAPAAQGPAVFTTWAPLSPIGFDVTTTTSLFSLSLSLGMIVIKWNRTSPAVTLLFSPFPDLRPQ